MQELTPFTIFLSHRQEDRDIAVHLRRVLEGYTHRRLKIVFADVLQGGTDWRHSVVNLIQNANMFLFLYTSSTSDWRWCMYEAGLFRGSGKDLFKGPDKEKIQVALVPEGVSLPSPISDFQVVTSDTRSLVHFLTDLFGTDRYTGMREAIAPEIASNQELLNQIADEISKVLFPEFTTFHARALTIRCRKAEIKEHEGIPDNAFVDGDASSLEIMGILPGKSTWSGVKGRSQNDPTWMTELDNAVRTVISGRVPRQIESKLESPDGRLFAPILYKHDLREYGDCAFHVLFFPIEGVPVDPLLVFVLCAFRAETNPMFEATVAAAKQAGLQARRVKDVLGDYKITEKIITMIQQARMIVADLTFERPNVYFELGFARGLNKTVITTARKGTELHFDVKDWTCIEYDDSRSLEKSLEKRFQVELGEGR